MGMLRREIPFISYKAFCYETLYSLYYIIIIILNVMAASSSSTIMCPTEEVIARRAKNIDKRSVTNLAKEVCFFWSVLENFT